MIPSSDQKMSVLKPPLFVPFNVRNQIILENSTELKDITDLPSKTHYETLMSYMTEKQIFQGINKRLGHVLYSKARANFTVSNSVEAFKKNQVTTRYGLLRQIAKEYLYSHKSSLLSCGNLINPFISFAGFDDGSLKAYWKFNEASGDIINQSQSSADLGSGADIQITGATYGQSGAPLGDSLLFDGVNDFGVTGTSKSQFNFLHNSATMAFTIAWWMKKSAGTDTDGIFDEVNNNTSNIGLMLRLRTSAQIAVHIYEGSGTVVIAADGVNDFIPDNTTWYFYMFRYDQSLGSANLKARRNDGNEYTANKGAGTPSTSDSTNVMNFARQSDAADFFNALYSEWSVWDKIMSASDETDLYNSGSGLEIY